MNIKNKKGWTYPDLILPFVSGLTLNSAIEVVSFLLACKVIPFCCALWITLFGKRIEIVYIQYCFGVNKSYITWKIINSLCTLCQLCFFVSRGKSEFARGPREIGLGEWAGGLAYTGVVSHTERLAGHLNNTKVVLPKQPRKSHLSLTSTEPLRTLKVSSAHCRNDSSCPHSSSPSMILLILIPPKELIMLSTKWAKAQKFG